MAPDVYVAWVNRRFAVSDSFAIGQLTLVHGGGRDVMLGPDSSLDSREAPVALEQFRQFIRHTEVGAYRPLSGSKDVRTGWRLTLPDRGALVRYLELVYPLALTHVLQAEAGTLEVTPVVATLCRQTGDYAKARTLPAAARAACGRVLCRGCIRTPLWLEGYDTGAERGLPSVPCPEACSVYIALAEEAAHWGPTPPHEEPEHRDIGWAEFHRDGNRVRNALIRCWPGSGEPEGTVP